MIASCKVEHRQGVPVPFTVYQPTGRDAYLLMTGPLDDVLRSFRSVVGALEIAADTLVDVYDLTVGDPVAVEVRARHSAVNIVATNVHVKEDGT